MRRIAHLSDLHFGRIDPAIVDPLIAKIHELQPEIVAVSGDLTQRARSHQFKAARAFLDALPKPQIIVPGNHDVPLHNVFNRFARPLDKYRRYITDDLTPFYADDELAIVGVNTSRSLVIKGGRVNQDQIEWMRQKLCAFGDEVMKAVVTHHPFDLPEGHDERDLVGRSHLAMQALADCGADLFLAGHLHIGSTGHTAKRYKIEGHSALVVSAGTATSTRGRGEANSFNFISIDGPNVKIDRFSWRPEESTFAVTTSELFHHTDEGWARDK